MRLHALLIVAIVLYQSCTSSKRDTSIEEEIHKVETSLGLPVYIEGDSLWTIEDRMKHYGIPGVSIAVIKDNKIIWSKAYGVVDKESNVPVTTQTLFQAGSISKPVSAYGALKIVESGKINLNKDVNQFLRLWKLPENEFTKEEKVTLKHLLSHTGGVTVHGFLGYSPDLEVPTLIQVLDGTPPANSPPIRVDKMPGQSWRYSGGGYCIMQQMLIDQEGIPFPEILKRDVLSPLGMNSSTFDQPLDSNLVVLAATGYLPNGNQTKGKRHIYPEMAAAGLWTTAEDLARFAIDVQQTVMGQSSKVLSQTMTEQMLTPFVSDTYGLGMGIDKIEEDVYFGHDGWDEGFCAQLIAHKNKGYGAVIMINSNHPQFMSELSRAVARTYQWSNFIPTYNSLQTDPETQAKISGRYKNGNDGLIEITEKNNRLFFKYIRSQDINELVKITDTTFIRRVNDQPIQFIVNPEDEKLNLIFLNENGGGNKYSHPKLNDSEKIPFEYVLSGDFDGAISAYKDLMKADPKDVSVDEMKINEDGYDFLRGGDTERAILIFKVNMILYPGSYNVYDSYAEACYKKGDKTLAIDNYKKSLKLNPDNQNAINMLKELEAIQ
jgi:CubicO group peptidase (beta-lactamase class C family)